MGRAEGRSLASEETRASSRLKRAKDGTRRALRVVSLESLCTSPIMHIFIQRLRVFVFNIRRLPADRPPAHLSSRAWSSFTLGIIWIRHFTDPAVFVQEKKKRDQLPPLTQTPAFAADLIPGEECAGIAFADVCAFVTSLRTLSGLGLGPPRSTVVVEVMGSALARAPAPAAVGVARSPHQQRNRGPSADPCSRRCPCPRPCPCACPGPRRCGPAALG